MSDILTTVTEAESKVIDTMRSLQKPVVGYVRRGVELADSRLPDVKYPAVLPKPRQVLDSQFGFLKALIDAQHDLMGAIADAMAPLAGIEPEATKERARKTATRSGKTTAAAV